jgi:TP901 family phage tail tape measure protein
MAFDAGAVIGHAKLDNSGWKKGAAGVSSSTKGMTGSIIKGQIAFAAISKAISITTNFLKGSITKANEFQKSMSNVSTLVDTAKVSVDSMADGILQLDSRLGTSKELTDALYQALSAGVEPAKAIEFVGESAKFAKAGLTDAFTAVDVLTTALNAYGLEAGKAGDISDILFTTIKLGKTTGQELASTLGDVIPTAATLGVGMEEIGSAMVAFTKQGINTANATTQLRAVFSSFIKPSTAMTKALEDAGYASGSALIEAEGLTGALQFLQDTTDGNIEQLGKLLPNQRALKGAFALSGQGAIEFTAAMEAMQDRAGASDEAFEKQRLTFEELKNDMDKVQILIGNALLPVIDNLVGIVLEMNSAFKDFLTDNEAMEKMAMGLAGAFTFLKEILGIIMPIYKEFYGTIIKEMVNAFKKVGEAIFGGGEGGEGLVTGFTILTGALQGVSIAVTIGARIIGMYIGALADLVVGLIEAGKTAFVFFQFLAGEATWKEVKEQASSAGDAFVDLGLNIATGVTDLIGSVTEDILSFTDTVKENAENMEKSVTDSVNRARQNAQESNEELTEETEEQNEQQVLSWKEKWQEILKSGKVFAANMAEVIKDVAAAFNAVLGEISNIVKGIEGIFDQYYANQQAELENHYNALDAQDAEAKEKRLAAEEANRENLLAINQRSFEQGLISEKTYEDRKTEIKQQSEANRGNIDQAFKDKQKARDEKKRDEENKLKRDQFNTEKAFAIVQVWLDYATAVMGFWSAYGGIPFAGPVIAGVLTGVATGIATAQTVLIGQQQFVPAMASGGTVGMSPANAGRSATTVMMNEEGGEIATLPDGTVIVPNDISRRIADNVGPGRGGPVVNNHVSFDGATITDNMSLDKVANRVLSKLGRKLGLAT